MTHSVTKRLLNLFCACLLAGLASTVAAEELTPAKKADIQKLLTITGAVRMADQMGTLMLQTLRQSLTNCRNCTPRTFNVIERETLALFRERLNATDGLMDRMLVVYHNHFSQAEVRQLLAFYETPIGKRLISETPLITQEGFAAGKEWGQSLGPVLQSRLQAAFDKEKLPMPEIPAASPAATSRK